MAEGTEVSLFGPKVYLGQNRWHKGPNFSQVVGSASEAPMEAFEKLFPRYQIESYRGISLGLVKDPKYFDHPRWRGLEINPVRGGSGSVDKVARGPLGLALRHQNKRENEEYLRSEAEIIMKTVLPMREPLYDSQRRQQLIFELTREELRFAFRNMGLLD